MSELVVYEQGERFGRLTVLPRRMTATGATLWCSRCDCGAEVAVCGRALRRGEKKTCGCRIGTMRSGPVVHGQRTRSYTSPTYLSWKAMRRRCLEPGHHKFPSYGGAGVKVCERWHDSFANFLADMGERPPGKTLDRWPDPAGDYEPGNCRWATALEQRHNHRPVPLNEGAIQ